ncbi:Gfo/Idh/MocA family oxidoreductase [Shewanella sp. 202IG2-18]|uniref:Gfo/Idh/MocA family protein n=1 Tax=Parashewanella hymeniacidonis TaxID=2807618 RepID=UPI001961963B|nr:Gfo/Idh/MocA family oxidoreductase [Parashewanella hymeniacidonis]MBM7071853.1 Gfo/Idh/MocA family oxidoreductase [Parashewanella hymeniacidonis]
MKSLNWGFLGTSFISSEMASAIAKEGRSQIIAAAGRNEERLMAFTQQHQIEKSYTDFDALINDSDVDIVYIALPNHLHHIYVEKAAKAGKAILCEKSLAVSLEQTKVVEKALAENPVFFAEGLMYLHHPVINKLLELLKQGVIGNIKQVNASYCAAISEFVNSQGGGAIYNLGCYPASIAYRCIEAVTPHSVSDYALQAIGRKGTDGNICETSASLNFDDSVQVQLHCAEDYGTKSSLQILGEKGYLVFDSNPWLPQEQNSFHYAEYEGQETVVNVEAEGDAFYYQVLQVIDAVEQNKFSLAHPQATLADSIKIMDWLVKWQKHALAH